MAVHYIGNVETLDRNQLGAPQGWVRGKKGHVPTKLWVNNGVKEHYILLEKQQEYVSKGFSSGRLKSSMLRKSMVV